MTLGSIIWMQFFSRRVRGRGGQGRKGDEEAVRNDSEMATPFEIGQAGEGIVVQWLKEAGYTMKRWDTASSGSTDIEAENSSGHILLVQVKSAVHPNEPPSLSSDEERKIKSRATKIGAEDWEARGQLSAGLELIGEIRWRKLSQAREKTSPNK